MVGLDQHEVLPSDRKGADSPLSRIVIHRDVAIAKELSEVLLLVDAVTKSFSDCPLWCHLSIFQLDPLEIGIADRWDLTLECIRRHYAGEESPLSKVIEGDKAFYDLFVDFKGYVDFFLMQDCVSEDYSSVDIWMGDASFEKNGLPETVEDYFKFLVKEHIFLDKRNARIQEYCIKHQAVGKQNSD